MGAARPFRDITLLYPTQTTCFSKPFKVPPVEHAPGGRPHAENDESDQCQRQANHFVDMPLIERRYCKESDETREKAYEAQRQRHPDGRVLNEAMNSEHGKGRPAHLQKTTDNQV